MPAAYNDGAVPIGVFTVALKSGVGAGSAIGTYICESFNLTTPANVINRPNEIGGPNGWVAVSGQETATGVLQIAGATTETPKIGYWFDRAMDRSSATTSKWVITNVSEAWETGGYAKVSCNFQCSHTHPAT
jgi:hypothetical protein